MKLTQNNLLQFLNKRELDPLLQKETDQIYLVMKILNLDVPVFFAIRSENQLLQIIAYLPFDLPKTTRSDVARLLHLVNKELDMPGFGMDEFQGVLFFRSVVPCLDHEMNEKLIELHLGTTRIACETFMEAISAISAGSVKFDEVLNQTK